MLAVYTRWDIEDFDVIAFAYTPIPSSLKKHLALSNSGLSSGNLLSKADVSVAENDCVFIIDPRTDDDLEVKENNTHNNNNINNEKKMRNSMRKSMMNKGIEANIWPHMTQQVFLGKHYYYYY